MAAIVGILASLVRPAMELGKCFAEPIKRQFNYLSCFTSNIQNLRDEAKKLDDARVGLQMRVNTAENNAEEILPEVKTWLEKTNEAQVNMIGIESEIPNIRGGCLAVKSRFSLSKRAKSTTEHMKELRDSCKFNPISQPPPPASMVSIPLPPTYEFESRKHIEEDIMIALRGKRVNMMGICGMGGVGKTTMAKSVMKTAREEHLFDETVIVVVTQQVEMLRIQDDIAKSLGLKLEEGSLSSKAHALRTRLVGGKRILIVLDDVWKNLKLEDLGIPCESCPNVCTLLLTSRDRDVLNQMGAQKVCEIQTLSELEAWSLFKDNVGVAVDDQNLLSIAQEVATECKGLPIALINVALALKDKKYKSSWEHALQQLRCSNPVDMPKILEDVYNPLKLSYNFLESQHAKSIFLLCCLFPEDYNVSLEYLTFYAMGLCLFEDIRNLRQARNRTFLLVEMLKSRFLLLEGWNKYHVRMHDVVRDVAIFLASEEGHVKGSDCTWISSFIGESIELSTRSKYSNLHLLLIDEQPWFSLLRRDAVLQINDNSFEGIIKLNVLSMRCHSLRSLPHTTQLLKYLRTLILDSCMYLETISVVGELENLEILSCRDCYSIENLPVEIGGLDRLKLLEFSNCNKLQTVAPGIISSLVGLEELKMVKSFDKWEAEDGGKERKNTTIDELESLSKLTCLEIEIEDSTLAAKQIRLPTKMAKYDIIIGFKTGCLDYGLISKGFEKEMKLYLPGKITLGNWIYEFVGSVERMCLGGDGSNKLDLGQAQNMRSLTFRDCSTVKKLANIETSSTDDGRYCSTSTVFPLLEFLQLENLPNLEEICDIDGRIPDEGSRCNSFKCLKELRLVRLPELKHLWKNRTYQNNVVSLCGNLSSIYIDSCHSLRNLSPLATANDCLLHLEMLQIRNCEMIEEVFCWSKGENEEDTVQKSHRIIIFPKLKLLGLRRLPRLTAFCKGIKSIELPLLTQVNITQCPQLKSLVSTTTSTNRENFGGIGHDDGDDSLPLFCKSQKVAFGNLKEPRNFGYEFEDISSNNTLSHQVPNDSLTRLEELSIEECDNIMSLFSSSIAGNLINLTKLNISTCGDMVKVIEEEEEEKRSHIRSHGENITRLFPRLQQLRIWELPKLEIFCEWRSYALIELPSLKALHIFDCPKMDRLSSGSLTAPNLKTIRMVFVDIAINADQDLNDQLQQHLFRAQEEGIFYKWAAKVKGARVDEYFVRQLTQYGLDLDINLVITDSTLAAERVSLPSNIEKYDITSGDPQDYGFFPIGFERSMRLHLPREITLGNWIHQFIRSVEYMRLKGEGSNNLDLGQAQKMRSLTFGECSTVKKLENVTSSTIDDGRDGSTTILFPLLEFLRLENLANLEEICDIDGPISDEGSGSNLAFENLKELKLRTCRH